MKIQLITLLDCKRCASLKNQLTDNNIIFGYTNCEDNPNQCDSLETLLGIEEYPIVLITDKNDNILEILYITRSYDTIGKKRDFDGGVLGIPLYSIDSIVQYIKNRLI
jgi:hypothetical protein